MNDEYFNGVCSYPKGGAEIYRRIRKESPPPIPQGIVIRRAEKSDYQGILNISRNIYQGTDYMMAYFDRYMNNPERCLYVALLESRVVGFIQATVTDHGRTFVARSARTAEDMRSQKIFPALRSYLFMDILLNFPNVIRYRGTSSLVDFWTDAKLKSMGRTCAATRTYIGTVGGSEFSNIIKTVSPQFLAHLERQAKVVHVIRRAPTPDILFMLSDDVTRARLFPDDIAMVQWHPFDPRPHNAKYMLEQDLVCLLGVDRCGHIQSFSVARWIHPCFRGSSIDMNFYGTQDVNTLKLHIALVAKNLLPDITNTEHLPLAWRIQLPKTFLMEETKQNMLKMPLFPNLDASGTSMVIEEPLPKPNKL